MPDLHGWITQQIDRLENDVRSADKEHGRTWATRWEASGDYFEITDDSGLLVADQVQPGAAGLIVRHDPAAVLRRCAADRKILGIHKPAGGDWNSYACDGCGIDSEYGHDVDHTNDCETLLALAEGYGLTPELLATLDRPELERPTPTGPSLIPDALAEAMYGNLIATYLGTRPVEPSPKEKALKILEPELKRLPLYAPIAEESGPA